jgi:hypothetical protein
MTQYAKAQDEDEIPDEDIDLINPTLNSDEIAMLEQQGLGSLLGEIGEHLAKGTAPPAKRSSNSTASYPDKKDQGPAKIARQTAMRQSMIPVENVPAESSQSAQSKGKKRGQGPPLLPKSAFFRRSSRGSIFFLYALTSL